MKTKEEKHMDYFYKDNYKEGMTVYLLYTGYDLCVGKYAPRKKYSITVMVSSPERMECSPVQRISMHQPVRPQRMKAFFIGNAPV